MSAALDLIQLAEAAGVTLRPRLWAEGSDRLDSATRAELRARESEVLRLLADPDFIILCGRCGTASPRFTGGENLAGWRCPTCLPRRGA